MNKMLIQSNLCCVLYTRIKQNKERNKLMIAKKVMTVYEVADYLQVHFNTAYELVRQGKIKHIKVGRQIRIPEAFLNEFVDGGGAA